MAENCRVSEWRSVPVAGQFGSIRSVVAGPGPGRLHSRGLHFGHRALSRPSPIALVDIDYHVTATLGSGTADVYGVELGAFGQHRMGRHFAGSLLPLRHILDLYLLRLQPAARSARRSAGRRLF